MTAGHLQDAGSVFVNCPFDAGYKAIYKRYQLFRRELPEICREFDLDLDEVSFNDFAQFVAEWLWEQ